MRRSKAPPAFFEDWTDSFYGRDIQELFGVRNRTAFIALFRLIAMRNGGLPPFHG